MRFLILGGTAWLGRAVAVAALGRGHSVTCVARGSDVPPGVTLVNADRDLDDALAGVASSRWDAVVDVSRQPGQVRRSVRDLAPVADRYVFVSTCSVYASLSEPGIDEGAALLEPLEGDEMASIEEYGPAKVACELAVTAGFGAGRSVIVRPGLIGGPGDRSWRSVYWPVRFAAPSAPEGTVLVPDDPDLLTSVIDARDLADWIVTLAEDRAAGVFNAVGDVVWLGEHLAAARAVAGHAGPVVAAAPEWLMAHGVGQWAGPRSLPLWVADDESRGIGAVSNARAREAGLRPRRLEETLADALAWARSQPTALPMHSGLTDDEECALLAELAGKA